LSSYQTSEAHSLVASYPGRVRGERRPGIDCLRMRNHSQKILEICLCLETVCKINMCMSDIFPYHRKVEPFCWLIYFQLHEKWRIIVVYMKVKMLFFADNN